MRKEMQKMYFTHFRRKSETTTLGLKPAGIGAMFAIAGAITKCRERRQDIVRAIDEDDDEELQAICIGEESLTIAAEIAIAIHSPAKVMKILEIAK